MSGDHGIIRVGQSEAGKRILALGLARVRQEREAAAAANAARIAAKEARELAWRRRAAAADLSRIDEAVTAAGGDRAITPGRIVLATAAAFDLAPATLRGSSRKPQHVIPRQVAALLCREITGLSTTRIGYALGGKDHTTILHAVAQAKTRMQSDPALAATVARIRAALTLLWVSP